jgi:hypothetical protein
VHVTTNGSQIYVSTAQHSVFGYDVTRQVVAGKPTIDLREICKDDIARDGISHLEIDLPHGGQTYPKEATQSLQTATQSQQARDERALKILLGSDKRGQIFGLEVPKYRAYQTRASTVFEMQLPQSVIKFAKGKVRMPWYERETPVCGVLEDDIIGATTDGTIYHFTLLTNEARLLLKFLENLMRWNEIEDKIALLYPEDRTSDGKKAQMNEHERMLWPIQTVVIDPEFVPGAQGQRARRDQYSIDGELLVPLLEGEIGTSVKTLSSILHRDAKEWRRNQESRYHGNQVDAKTRKFVELVGKALGDEDVSVNVATLDGNGDRFMHRDTALAVVRCVHWLHEVMRPIL